MEPPSQAGIFLPEGKLSPSPCIYRQFAVEVDASDTGVGVILSFRSIKNKIHICFFSPEHCHLRTATMRWGTENSWLLRLPWRSGDIGWRRLNNHSCDGLILITLNILSLLSYKRSSDRQLSVTCPFSHGYCV